MTERPLTETLYCISMRCDSPRCVLKRGFEEAPATENEGKCIHAHLRTYNQPTQLLAAGETCSPLPARSANWLDGLCFGVLLYEFGDLFLTAEMWTFL